MSDPAAGAELSLAEAADAFARLPAPLQLASLNPAMVEVDACRDAALSPVHWAYREGAHTMLHSFHAAAIPGMDGCDLQSAYGYGGPLSNSDEVPFIERADRAFGAWARSRSALAEFLRLHPLVPHERWYRGNLSPNRDTVVIDLEGDFAARYEGRRRTDVRRFVAAGLQVVRVDAKAMMAAFPPLYRVNMEQVGAAPEYYFPEQYFAGLLALGSTEGWLVYSGERVVAGALVLVSANAGVAEYHLGAMAPDSGHLKPTVGLLHSAAEHYARTGLRRFYLGGGRGTAPDDRLLFFKRGFSPSRATYRIGHRIHDPERYAALRAAHPGKAASGRVLFYRD